MSSSLTIIEMVTQLAQLLHSCGLNEIEVSYAGNTTRVRRDATLAATPAAAIAVPEPIVEQGCAVLSPTLGVFYAKPAPEDKTFVAMDQHVTEHQILGLVESMKVFYPIYAPCNGTITAINIQHGYSVEYQQKLMSIRPDAV